MVTRPCSLHAEEDYKQACAAACCRPARYPLLGNIAVTRELELRAPSVSTPRSTTRSTCRPGAARQRDRDAHLPARGGPARRLRHRPRPDRRLQGLGPSIRQLEHHRARRRRTRSGLKAVIVRSPAKLRSQHRVSKSLARAAHRKPHPGVTSRTDPSPHRLNRRPGHGREREAHSVRLPSIIHLPHGDLCSAIPLFPLAEPPAHSIGPTRFSPSSALCGSGSSSRYAQPASGSNDVKATCAPHVRDAFRLIARVRPHSK